MTANNGSGITNGRNNGNYPTKIRIVTPESGEKTQVQESQGSQQINQSQQ